MFHHIVVKPGWVVATNSDTLRRNSFITKRETLISKVFSILTDIGIKPVKGRNKVSKFRVIAKRTKDNHSKSIKIKLMKGMP